MCLYLPEGAEPPLLLGVSFIQIGCNLTKLCVVKDTHVKTANFGGSGVVICLFLSNDCTEMIFLLDLF